MFLHSPAFFRYIKKAGLLFLVIVFFSGCGQPRLFKETRLAMDTFAEISCYSSGKETGLTAVKEAFKEIERIERLCSRFDEESELSKVNALAGERGVVVSEELLELISRSIYYSEVSGGAFDITKKSGYSDIVLDRDRLSIRFLDKDIKIDLGGIAKGYAVDRAIEVLRLHAIEDALVNIGGNIFAVGSPPEKDAWQIGIRDPEDRTRVMHRLSLRDKAISTSANYERSSHIINPATGNPVEDIGSVTVVASSAEEADALSTAVFVMGREKGPEFIKSMKGPELYMF